MYLEKRNGSNLLSAKILTGKLEFNPSLLDFLLTKILIEFIFESTGIKSYMTPQLPYLKKAVFLENIMPYNDLEE